MIDGRLAWGIVSTAHINDALIPPLQRAERSLLVAVASRSPQKALSYAEARGIPKAYGSYEEMLADPDIDVVYNPLPNDLHAEWSAKALAAGKHVLCEKPLTLSVAEHDRLAAAAKAAGKVLAEAFMYRHHAQTRFARKLAVEGTLGKIQFMQGSFTFPIKKETDIRLDPARGGGSLWDVGCYPVSYARCIAGCEPAEARGRQVLGRLGVDERFYGELLFKGGTPIDGLCVLHFDCGFRSLDRMRFEVVGSEGTLTIPSPFKPAPGDTMRLHRKDRTVTIEMSRADLYGNEVADMEAAILDGAAQGMSLADSRGNVAAIDALYEAARTGGTVRLG